MTRHFYATEFTENQCTGAHRLVLYVFTSRAQRNEWVAENSDGTMRAMDPTKPEVYSNRNSYSVRNARGLVHDLASTSNFYIDLKHSWGDGDWYDLPQWIRDAC